MARIHQTVIVECERCGRQSEPLLVDQADAWLSAHEQRVHVPEDRAALLAQHGHVASTYVEWFDQDDSSGYATCSCGFRSRSAKACWLDELAQDHLKEMEQKLGLGPVLPDSAVTPPLDPAKRQSPSSPRTRPSALSERAQAS